MAQELKAALSEFVGFAQTLRGDGKSEAQTFLDHFFRALGHDGVIEAGAGEKITPPSVPLPAEEHRQFITDDCIQPASG